MFMDLSPLFYSVHTFNVQKEKAFINLALPAPFWQLLLEMLGGYLRKTLSRQSDF